MAHGSAAIERTRATDEKAARFDPTFDTARQQLAVLKKHLTDRQAKGEATPVAWLTDEENEKLKQALSTSDICDISNALITAASSLSEISVAMRLAQHESLRLKNSVEEVDSPALLDKITDAVKLMPQGSFLLDLVKRDGLQIHLMQRKEAVRTDYDAAAYIKGKDVYLVDVTESNIGSNAVSLAHELEHRWQKNEFVPFFVENNVGVDPLVRTWVTEAATHAAEYANAFVLEQNGTKMNWPPNSNERKMLGYFRSLYDQSIKEKGASPAQALADATSGVFLFHAGPGLLDRYEQKHSVFLSSMNPKNLPAMINRSPYAQEDFLVRLTSMSGTSYLRPADIPMIQEELMQIGQSKHARVVEPQIVEASRFTL
ncbi:MAG: hypothetical protein P4M15_11005 [Alphaproteobacteria bacterium]|nr:hypothetical protein [Alphaproteobacteria bacterium]